MSPSDVLRALLRKLLEAHQAGIQVVLAVDEAQNMPEQTLESLRILSNLETTRTKLVQIILVGQPELDALLKKHSLRQLAQRVAVCVRLKRLTFNESCRYIQHRTRASARSRSLFTKPAQWYIALTARGIPRTINICCDNALINGYGHSARRISIGIAREACSSLEYRSPLTRAAAAAIVLLVVIAGALYGPTLLDHLEALVAARHSDSGGRSPAAKTTAPAPAAIAPGRAIAAATPAVTAPAAPGSEPGPGQPAAVDPAIHAVVKATAPASADPSGASARLRWVVRTGDSVYKACLETYGSCDDRTLRAVLADNPQIGSGAMIRRGDILIMPESIGWLRAKPH
jgi:general secretion pathway protein A